jgi:hypothetical protein
MREAKYTTPTVKCCAGNLCAAVGGSDKRASDRDDGGWRVEAGAQVMVTVQPELLYPTTPRSLSAGVFQVPPANISTETLENNIGMFFANSTRINPDHSFYRKPRILFSLRHNYALRQLQQTSASFQSEPTILLFYGRYPQLWSFEKTQSHHSQSLRLRRLESLESLESAKL